MYLLESSAQSRLAAGKQVTVHESHDGSVGDAHYRAEYDLDQNQVLLLMTKGSRRDPPPLSYLPRFPGLRTAVAGPRGVAVIRQRGGPVSAENVMRHLVAPSPVVW